MKEKLSLLFCCFLLSLGVFAQKSMVKDAEDLFEDGKIIEAKETIDKALKSKDSKMLAWLRTWTTKANIYQAVVESKDAKLVREKYLAMEGALDAFDRAFKLAKKEKHKAEIKPKIEKLALSFEKEAEIYLNKYKFQNAFKMYKLSLKTRKLISSTSSDNSINYKIGLAALFSKKYKDAIKFFGKSIAAKQNLKDAYFYKSLAHKKQNQIKEMLSTLEKGIKENGENNGRILIAWTVWKLERHKFTEVISFLKKQNQTPTTKSLLALCSFEKDEKINQNTFTNSAKQKDEFSTNYLAGLYFYKKAEQVIQANFGEKSIKNSTTKQVKDLFEKALPYFEKAKKQAPFDGNTARKINTIYREIGDWDKVVETKIISDALNLIKL